MEQICDQWRMYFSFSQLILVQVEKVALVDI